MILVQAVDLVTMLKGLLPRMTQEQERAATALLMDYDYVQAEPHVSRYAKTASDFNVGDLRRALPWRDDGVTLHQRTRQYLMEQQRDASRTDVEKARIDQEYQSIAAGLSEEAITRLSTDAIQNVLDDPWRQRVIKRGPEKSRILRVLIVKFMADKSQSTATA